MQSAPSAEKRSADRFGLALPITMEGEECAGHDLSATGLLIESAMAPEVGATVALTLEYVVAGQDRNLACRGEVVRVERHGMGYNIAVRLSEPLFEGQAGAGRAPA